MNIASIDIGTNTVLLLIVSADIKSGRFETITNHYKIPRLGRGLLPNSNIPEANIIRFMKVMDEYDVLIKKYRCETVLLKATNAMRIASNSEEIINSIKKNYGYQIDIIPGEEEARLSYLGASSTIPNSAKKTVIDIGGGSTEIIFGNDDEIIFRKSIEIGAVSLTEEYVNSDPPAAAEILEMRNNISNKFSEINFETFYNSAIIAVAGTPTTLSGMKQNIKDYDEKRIEGSILDKADFKFLIKILSETKPGQFLRITVRLLKGVKMFFLPVLLF